MSGRCRAAAAVAAADVLLKKAAAAAEIAAAGGHNLILVGAPGAGKSMIAKALSGILPSMTWEECREVSRIYSVCGKTTGDQPLVWERPFQAPHHTVPVTALTGGGMPPKPGVFSLATHGILFFDEFPEFPLLPLFPVSSSKKSSFSSSF